MNKANILALEQGSDAWLAARRGHITATDAAVIMGVSPYKTQHQLWKEKRGEWKQQVTPAMQAGTLAEEGMRARAEILLDTPLFPAVAICPAHPWMMASLDGLSPDQGVIFEAKLCNRKVWDFLGQERRALPEQHVPQAQHQLACIPLARVAVWVFQHQGETRIVEVHRDSEYIDMLIHKENQWFDEHVTAGKEPSLSEIDVVNREDDLGWVILSQRAKEAYGNFQSSKVAWEESREALIEAAEGQSSGGLGVCVRYSERGGSVDTKAMAKDGIDIDKYRGAPAQRVTVTIKTNK